jgi:hypothetical protein
MPKRPLLVTLLSLLLIVMGTVGLIYHLREFRGFSPFPLELVLISLLRILAIVSGAYMLRGANWARWLAVSWIALHVGVSYFNGWGEMAMHAVILVVFVVALFNRRAGEYFRAGQ